MSGRSLARGAVVFLAGTLLVSGCSGKAAEDDGGDAGAQLKTGPGVTADTITVGALTDLSGVFGAQGKVLIQGNQLYIDKVNKAGGICDRQLKLVTQDHGYDVQKAVGLYSQLEPQVAGFTQFLGSPIQAALSEQLTDDNVVAVATGWSAALLKNPHFVLTGSTYDLEAINGIDYLTRAKGLKAGDTIGHIAFEGDFGNNALQGSTFAAEKLGLKLEKVQIKPTDVDLTAQVTALKAKGVKAIVLSNGPRQTASVAGVARSVGLNVPLIANTPSFDPAILATPAKDALAANLTVLSSYVPYGADDEGAKEVAAALPAAYPDATPNGATNLGYLSTFILTEALKRACENNDLSRDGVLAAFRQLSNLETLGLTPTLSYATPGQPPMRGTYVQKVDPAVPGGLTIVEPAAESELAKGYTVTG